MTVVGVAAQPMRRVSKVQNVRNAITGFVALIMPAFILALLYAASFYLLDTPVGFSMNFENVQADPAWWMQVGHLTLGLAFFLVALTNRAKGAGFALLHVVMSWAMIGAAVWFLADTYGWADVRADLPPGRVLFSFLGALFVAHVFANWVFDLQRGVPWWKAPLISGIMGPLIFVLIFYPFGHAGMDVPWGAWMGLHGAALIGVTVLSLVPYAMLRGQVRPAPGLGGR